MSDFIVVDVGASNGAFSKFILSTVENSIVHAVEPNMVINQKSLFALKLEYGDRVSIHPFALAEESGYREFFGSSQINGQIGSLRKFNSQKIWESYLNQILDIERLSTPTLVPVKSIFDFLRDTKIHTIDFLKIDAQGYDVDLLEKFLNTCSVRCLVLEVNTTAKLSENIYEGNNNLDSLIPIIFKHNLKILKIIPHHDLTELNLFLAADFNEGQKILINLKMNLCPTFERYWDVIVKSRNKKKLEPSFAYIINSIVKLLIHPRIYFRKLYTKILSTD
jgi:FkbM family methyltransferase